MPNLNVTIYTTIYPTYSVSTHPVPNEDEEDDADDVAGLLHDREHKNVEGNELDGEVHSVRGHAHGEPREE